MRARAGGSGMSLVVRNLQRAVPLRRAPLRGRLEAVRKILGVQTFDLGVVCVDNRSIQRINRVYRGKNAPTDVLSFPFHENLKAGEFPSLILQMTITWGTFSWEWSTFSSSAKTKKITMTPWL